MSPVPETWRPMLREAGIASSAIYSGLNAMRKADYARESMYDQAFFGLSVGLERMMKLAVLLHSRTAVGTGFPTEQEFRREYSHDLVKLFSRMEDIRNEYMNELQWELPNREISLKALEIISEFAKITRYHNLDILVGSARAARNTDPVEAWYNEVGSWILEHKYSEKKRKQDLAFAELAELALGKHSSIAHTAEDGSTITTLQNATLRSRQADLIQRESTVICACLGRHISELMWGLERAAQSNGARDIPFIHEHFRYLYNDEAYFRTHKTFGG